MPPYKSYLFFAAIEGKKELINKVAVFIVLSPPSNNALLWKMKCSLFIVCSNYMRQGKNFPMNNEGTFFSLTIYTYIYTIECTNMDQINIL